MRITGLVFFKYTSRLRGKVVKHICVIISGIKQGTTDRIPIIVMDTHQDKLIGVGDLHWTEKSWMPVGLCKQWRDWIHG